MINRRNFLAGLLALPVVAAIPPKPVEMVMITGFPEGVSDAERARRLTKFKEEWNKLHIGTEHAELPRIARSMGFVIEIP